MFEDWSSKLPPITVPPSSDAFTLQPSLPWDPNYFPRPVTNALPEPLALLFPQAALADIDNDEDLDHFIAGGAIPGRYPLATQSSISFNDAGGVRSKPLNYSNVVHGAAFGDFNNDRWLDLIVASPWSPPKIFLNTQHGFVDVTDSLGLRRDSKVTVTPNEEYFWFVASKWGVTR